MYILTDFIIQFQNTIESFEYACKLWNEQQEAGHNPIRKTITFFAANAINQNSPHIALEVITSVRNQSYVTLRNLKVVALCDLGRIQDALPLLRSVLSYDKPSSNNVISKQTYCRDVVSTFLALTNNLMLNLNILICSNLKFGQLIIMYNKHKFD